MASVRAVLASLEHAEHAIRYALVGKLGRIRSQRRKGGNAFYLDFRPYGRVWSHRGIRITDRETARRILEAIRAKVAEGQPLEEVLAGYMPPDSRPNLVPTWLERWLEVKRAEAAAGERSPTYFRELERYARPRGYFSFFQGTSIYELSYGVLEDWSLWMAGRGLSPKSRRNALGAFRSFLGWLKRRRELREIPEMPHVKVDEYLPRVLSIEDQDRVLAEIPEAERGIFLALAHLGIRPGEARALDVADYRDGWLMVDKAVKGPGANAPIRGTKTGKGKRLPVSDELREWIEEHVDPVGRLQGTLLFVNPRTGGRYTHYALRDTWRRATAAVGIEGVKLYEGTKHTMATDAIRRGVPERALQTFLGHSDVRSTRRYARISEHALIAVLRPRFVGGLSVGEKSRKKAERNQTVLVIPTGLEPVSPG